MSEHELIQPSSAHVWVKCPGSIPAQMLYPDNESRQVTLEGDLAHWIASEVLTSFSSSDGGIKTVHEYLDFASEDGVIVDQEMVSGVELYVNDVITVCQRNKIGATRKIEHFVHAPTIHERNGGTVDCHAIDYENKVIYVWDFKYGYVFVDVVENWQLINYARGILDHYNLIDYEFEFVFTIVQPRCYQSPDFVRRWHVKGVDLRANINALHYSANLSMSPNPKLVAGSHCWKCSARHSCKAHAEQLHLLLEIESDYDFASYDVERLSKEYQLSVKLAKLAESRRDSLYELMMLRAKSGKTFPDWDLKPKVSSLKWDKPDDEIIKLMASLYDVDLKAPDSAITPTQAINRKLIPENVVKKFASRKQKGMKLVEVDPNKAEAVFGQNNQGDHYES